MSARVVSSGVVHKVPSDFRAALVSSLALLDAWNGLTPLSRNEWICWITSVKKQETRSNHIQRACEDLLKGKRRPCCWPGCSHQLKNKKK